MIIYEFTHVPTGKVYIGSKKSNDAYYAGYTSSSATVSAMMSANPSEWTRAELCVVEEDDQWDFTRVVNLEQRLIKRRVEALGWGGVWNGSYHMSGNMFSPESEKKRIAAVRKAYELPETRKKVSDGVTSWLNTDEGKLNRKLRNARVNSDPVVKQKNSDSQIKRQSKFKEDKSTHPQWKGYIIGTNIETGEQITFHNMSEAKDAGFNKGCISNVLSGLVKQHKGYTWIRTKDKE